MDLEKLLNLQKKLENHILENHCTEGMSLLNQKILALQVELGELANETRCFKYWSNKSSSNKNIMLEEYVDCLHFILSLAIEKNFSNININPKELDYSLTNQLLNLYIDINDFIICSSKDSYLTLFEDFISLGFKLDFTEDDIEKAYIRKNNINHERQNTGY